MTMISITGHNKTDMLRDCPRRGVEYPKEGTVPFFTKGSRRIGTVPNTITSMTLMEILVVIVIIAVLAAVLLPAINTGLKKSYIRKAEVTITTLQNALEMYRRDWSNYPPSTSNDTQVNGNQGRLVSALTGTLPDGTPTPRKGQPYITFKKNDLNSTGQILLDPWGNAYVYVARRYIDTSGNWQDVTDGGTYNRGPFWPYTAPAGERSRNTYNIYSFGPDGKTNGGITDPNSTSAFDSANDGHNIKGYDADTNNDDDINSWTGQ